MSFKTAQQSVPQYHTWPFSILIVSSPRCVGVKKWRLSTFMLPKKIINRDVTPFPKENI